MVLQRILKMFGINKPKRIYAPMDIVIIGQNEGSSIIEMLESLKSLVPNSKRIWVLDRCTDNSEELLKQFNETYVKSNPRIKGRQTSYARNLGLSKTNPEHDVLFLDGDRVPVLGVLSNLSYWIHDIGLLLLDIDDRINMDFKEAYGNVHNGFYSCGIFFKRNAINEIVKFQKGELFKKSIQQHWGIEDTYLGDVCYHLGLTCDIYYNVRLKGRFDTKTLEDLDVLEERFKLRNKLHVKW